jgi:membrane protein implicated in regulation of membrane protease activity
MRESRWLLLFVALANIVLGFIRIGDVGISDEMWWDAAGLIAVGVLYAAAAIVRLFWIRFAFISEWLLDLLYSNTVLHAPRFQSVLFFILGAAFLYKMWKYRKAVLPSEIESDSTQQTMR